MDFASAPFSAARRRHLIAALSLAVTTVAAHATEYAIQPLGLTDPDHTFANGSYSSNISLTDTQGDVAGTSRGIAGSNQQLDAWLYNHSTRNISLISLPNSVLPADIRFYGNSTVTFMNSSGDAVGSTLGENQVNFAATWYYDSNTALTNRIGLTDSIHTDPNNPGYQLSNVTLLNSDGQAAGTSNRYVLVTTFGGQSAAGSDSWFYDKHTNATVQIGLTGGAYTGGSNQTSVVTNMNASGTTLGFSYKYTGTTRSSQGTSWIYDPSSNTTAPLTLPSSVMLPPAYPNLSPIAFQGNPINDAGDISLFATGPATGSATQTLAFLYNPASGYVHQMGLTSSFYQAANGTFFSLPYYLSASGAVAGSSQYYNGGSTIIGLDAWFFDKATSTTYPAGLTSPAFTSSTGVRNNVPAAIDPSGQYLVGVDSFNQTRFYWEYDNSTRQTSVIGFTGGNFVSSQNSSTTTFVSLNARGQSIGISLQFSGGTLSTGTQAWLFNPATAASAPIGLFDSLHTGPQGFPHNIPSFLNDNGVVVGNATRYINGTAMGTDGWYHDSNSNTTTPITLSTDANGNAKLNFKYLAPNGIALGSYEKYSGTTDLGQFAFLYNPASGATDLDLNVANLSDNGWQFLQSATAMLTTGQILGIGHLKNEVTSSNMTAFLLTAVSPGDANIDGKIDLSDLSTVLNNFGAATTNWTSGNFDHATTIDLTDLSDVLNNFGQSNSAPSTQSPFSNHQLPATPVPEPASLLLATLPLSLLLRRTRRHPK